MTLSFRTCSVLFVALTACAGQPLDSHGNGNGNGNGDGDGDGDGDTDPPPPPGEGITTAQFMQGLGMHECDDAFACKASFPSDAGVTFAEVFGASASACYGDASAYYDAAALDTAIAAGKVMWDGVAAGTCLDGITAPNCSTYWDDGGNYPDACGDAMVGTVADGGACTIDFECANPAAYCETTCTADSGQRRAPDSRIRDLLGLARQ